MPGYGKREWQYLCPGDTVAGLVVVEVLEHGVNQETTHYIVRQTCCGDEGEWTHRAVAKRATKGNTKCGLCTRRAVARKLGDSNRGESWALRRAAKQAARRGTVVVERGPWAGEYKLLGPMGPRYGFGGAHAANRRSAS